MPLRRLRRLPGYREYQELFRRASEAATPNLRPPIFAALRETFARKYGWADLRADVLAGVVVGIVAAPLSMALAIAVGVPPQHGLYTAIFAGAASALAGGCRVQVSGPTASFVVLAPIAAKFGLSGLLTAGFMAGIILVILGWARLGRLIQFIPYPVTTGFTTGIALVIATLQVRDALGLQTATWPDHYLERVGALWDARATVQWQELVVSAGTLALLTLIPRMTTRVPAPLLAIVLATFGVLVVQRYVPGLQFATIGSRFHTTIGGHVYDGIPPVLPVPSLPWGNGTLSLRLLRELLPAAFAIAMLGAIESLLSAVIADGMTRTQHDPSAELVGQGIGNIVAPIFGGIAATGALARTATNIRAGARSPFASLTHALVVLLSVLLLARFVAYVPMAALAGLLLRVAWNMSEVHHFTRLVRVAPKSDVIVLLMCFGLTVVFDIVVAVTVGVVTAALLFMKRMSELTEAKAVLPTQLEGQPGPHVVLPRRTLLYEISGPLFFGAVHNAVGALHATSNEDYKVLIVSLAHVPVIDATGLVALENAIDRVLGGRKHVVLAGPFPKPEGVFAAARMAESFPGLVVAKSLDEAIERARDIVGTPTIPPAS